MIKKLARKTFNEIVGNRDYRKAVAFAIFLKNKKPASVIKDFTYRELSRITGASPNTCKKRVETIILLGLAEITEQNNHRYLSLGKLRQGVVLIRKKKRGKDCGFKAWQPRHVDVDLGQICTQTLKEIERGLMALRIDEYARRKEYVKQLVNLAHNPKPFTPKREVKRAQKLCNKCGYGDTFTDAGLSYKKIAGWLHCSPNTVREIIALGESLEMFEVIRRGWELVKYVGGFSAKFAISYFQDNENRQIFATSNNIWHKPSLCFSHIGGSLAK